MPWDTTQLLLQFDRQENTPVLKYLITHHPSAHSDCTEELYNASRYIQQRKSFCPNPLSYAYLFLHTQDNIIYALAVGMSNLVFHLPAQLVTDALQSGGTPFREIPDDWVSFEAFQSDKPLNFSRSVMGHWCQIAFDFASGKYT